MKFTNADLGTGGTDSVGIAPVTLATQKDETLDAQGSTQSFTGLTVDMQLPVPSGSPDKCTAIKYACLIVLEGDNAQYVDADTKNNKKCVDIFTTMKNCRPGKVLTSTLNNS